jgi:hypothetical protein
MAELYQPVNSLSFIWNDNMREKRANAKGPYRLDAIRHCDANFQFSMTFNFTIFLCFSNIRNHLSNFSYLTCIPSKNFYPLTVLFLFEN